MGSPTARVAAIVSSIGLLAAPLFPVPDRAAPAATRRTLDRATDTTIDPSPFLTGGDNVRWNAATDRLAYMQTDASGFLLVAGTVAVSPAGDFMLGDVQDSLVRQTGLVKLVHFGCP